jgi:hypothetical protein
MTLAPIYNDAEFVGTTQFNAAAGAVYNGQLDDLIATHIPGVINPAAVTVTATGLIFTFTCTTSFGGLFSNGFIGRPWGTTAGSTTQVYTVNMASFVPGTGTQVVYIALTGQVLDEAPFTVAGPPPGHPDYDPSFASYAAYAETYNTLVFTATTTAPNNLTTLEFGRITLSAGQASVLPSQLVTSYQVPAGSILNDTGVTPGTYSLINGTVDADGRLYSAASATSISIPGNITSTAGTVQGAGIISTSNLVVDGAATVQGALTVYGAGSFESSLAAVGNIVSTTGLVQGVTLQTTPTGNLNIGTGSSLILGNLTVNGTVSGAGEVYAATILATGGTGHLSIGNGTSSIGGTVNVGGNVSTPNGLYGGYISSTGNVNAAGTVTTVNLQLNGEILSTGSYFPILSQAYTAILNGNASAYNPLYCGQSAVLQAATINAQFYGYLAYTGYKRIADPSAPEGYVILQWGSIGTPNNVEILFPISFPYGVCLSVVLSEGSANAGTWGAGHPTIHGSSGYSGAGFAHWTLTWNGSVWYGPGYPGNNCNWYAIGF